MIACLRTLNSAHLTCCNAACLGQKNWMQFVKIWLRESAFPAIFPRNPGR